MNLDEKQEQMRRRSEAQQKYAQSEKGRAAAERRNEKRRAKREGTENAEPAIRKVKDKYAWLNESMSRVMDDLRRTGKPVMTQIEHLRLWADKWFDLLMEDMKVVGQIANDDEKQQMLKALDAAQDRYRMLRNWVSGEETPEQRKYRLAHGVFLDEDDADFLKELLLGSPDRS